MSTTRTLPRGEMSRFNLTVLVFSALLILPAASRGEQSPQIAEQIAKAYGLDSFGQGRSHPLHLERRISRWSPHC